MIGNGKERGAPCSAASVIYTFAFAHHGSYSSYHRLAHYLGDQCVVDVTCRAIDRLPSRLSARLGRHWMKYSEYRLRRYLRSGIPRCVHYIHPETSLQQSWRWKGHHKFVLTVHQPQEFAARMRERCLNEGFLRGLEVADAVVVPDPDSLAAYREFAPQARFEVIPHGVDTEFFRGAPDRPRDPVILTVGNWLRDYECWAKVVRELLVRVPSMEFEVIASPETLREAQGALGIIQSPVRFLTGLSDLDLREAYERAQLLFLPLKDSAANNAVLEALAMGLPVVVSDLPASRFYVGNEAGRYVHNTDIGECVTTLARLTHDTMLRQRMTAAGRARAVAEFSWPRIASRYRALYQSLLEPLD
jgi:glycosyltransferase involved in cell wall biosynthesis